MSKNRKECCICGAVTTPQLELTTYIDEMESSVCTRICRKCANRIVNKVKKHQWHGMDEVNYIE